MKQENMAMPSDIYVAPHCETIYISNEGVLCSSIEKIGDDINVF